MFILEWYHRDSRLLGVILHGFMVNYKVTEEILQSKEMVGPVIAAIIQNPKIFTHSYDKKVLILVSLHNQ